LSEAKPIGKEKGAFCIYIYFPGRLLGFRVEAWGSGLNIGPCSTRSHLQQPTPVDLVSGLGWNFYDSTICLTAVQFLIETSRGNFDQGGDHLVRNPSSIELGYPDQRDSRIVSLLNQTTIACPRRAIVITILQISYFGAIRDSDDTFELAFLAR